MTVYDSQVRGKQLLTVPSKELKSRAVRPFVEMGRGLKPNCSRIDLASDFVRPFVQGMATLLLGEQPEGYAKPTMTQRTIEPKYVGRQDARKERHCDTAQDRMCRRVASSLSPRIGPLSSWQTHLIFDLHTVFFLEGIPHSFYFTVWVSQNHK